MDLDATPLSQDLQELGPLAGALLGDDAATRAARGDTAALGRDLGAAYGRYHDGLARTLASWRSADPAATGAATARGPARLAEWEARAQGISRQQAVARAEATLRRAAAGVALGIPYDAVTPAMALPAGQPPLFDPSGAELLPVDAAVLPDLPVPAEGSATTPDLTKVPH